MTALVIIYLVVHGHKKKHSLETCAQPIFMLLQDFFASARLHRVHNLFLPNNGVYYLYHLKSNNIIGQTRSFPVRHLVDAWVVRMFLFLSFNEDAALIR